MDIEKLRAWVDTLDRIQNKLPADISYTHLENYGEIRQYMKGLLKRMEQKENNQGGDQYGT